MYLHRNAVLGLLYKEKYLIPLSRRLVNLLQTDSRHGKFDAEAVFRALAANFNLVLTIICIAAVVLNLR